MNRNKLKSIEDIAKFITSLKNEQEITEFFNEILTEPEVETLSKRWQILVMLKDNQTQRYIAQQLKVSLCKVTRGAKILRNKNSVISKYIKEKHNVSV